MGATNFEIKNGLLQAVANVIENLGDERAFLLLIATMAARAYGRESNGVIMITGAEASKAGFLEILSESYDQGRDDTDGYLAARARREVAGDYVPPCREFTSICAAELGECLRCGAANGEACRGAK